MNIAELCGKMPIQFERPPKFVELLDYIPTESPSFTDVFPETKPHSQKLEALDINWDILQDDVPEENFNGLHTGKAEEEDENYGELT